MDKYTVLKNEDVFDCHMKYRLKVITEHVTAHREKQGKPTNNSYIVINTDEPYIDEIIEVLKRHGHWGDN